MLFFFIYIRIYTKNHRTSSIRHKRSLRSLNLEFRFSQSVCYSKFYKKKKTQKKHVDSSLFLYLEGTELAKIGSIS